MAHAPYNPQVGTATAISREDRLGSAGSSKEALRSHAPVLRRNTSETHTGRQHGVPGVLGSSQCCRPRNQPPATPRSQHLPAGPRRSARQGLGTRKEQRGRWGRTGRSGGAWWEKGSVRVKGSDRQEKQLPWKESPKVEGCLLLQSNLPSLPYRAAHMAFRYWGSHFLPEASPCP